MKQEIGSNLRPDVQRECLARFGYRSTGNHNRWLSYGCRLQFRDDAEWLAKTKFWIRADGGLARNRHYCESSPTWPNNPELRAS
jgi:hypothetical protein